jgi:hypothetical protein
MLLKNGKFSVEIKTDVSSNNNCALFQASQNIFGSLVEKLV